MKAFRLTTLVLLIAWLISLGIVYTLGLLTAFAFHRAPGEGGMEGLNTADRAYAVLVERELDTYVEWAELKSGDPETALPGQVRQLLLRLNREPDAARRAIAAETIAAAYPSRKVVPAIQVLLEEPPQASRLALLEALFERWGEIDGRSALEFTRTAVHPSRPELSGSLAQAALGGWARQRAESAWNWILQNPVAGLRQAERLATVLARAKGLDDDTLISWISGLEDRMIAEEVASREAVRRLAMEGPRGAFVFAESVTQDYEGRINVLSAVLTSWARQDVATVVRWVESLPEADRAWTLAPLADSWSREAPAATLEWLARQPPSPTRDLAQKEAARQWLRVLGPVPLGEFLNAADDLEPYGGAIEMLSLETMSMDPETAYSWAELISDRQRRQYTMSLVAAYWASFDPETAMGSIAAADLDAPPVSPEELEVLPDLSPPDPESVEAVTADPAGTDGSGDTE